MWNLIYKTTTFRHYDSAFTSERESLGKDLKEANEELEALSSVGLRELCPNNNQVALFALT